MSRNVAVPVPEEVSQLLDPAGTGLKARVLEALVLHLFQQGVVSSRKAAELLGITWDALLGLLRDREISYMDMDYEELLEDLRVAEGAHTSRNA